jgi:hypothetical protein
MDATLKEIKDYFGYTSLSAFSADWRVLPEKDRAHIREGIGNHTFTY